MTVCSILRYKNKGDEWYQLWNLTIKVTFTVDTTHHLCFYKFPELQYIYHEIIH